MLLNVYGTLMQPVKCITDNKAEKPDAVLQDMCDRTSYIYIHAAEGCYGGDMFFDESISRGRGYFPLTPEEIKHRDNLCKNWNYYPPKAPTEFELFCEKHRCFVYKFYELASTCLTFIIVHALSMTDRNINSRCRSVRLDPLKEDLENITKEVQKQMLDRSGCVVKVCGESDYLLRNPDWFNIKLHYMKFYRDDEVKFPVTWLKRMIEEKDNKHPNWRELR